MLLFAARRVKKRHWWVGGVVLALVAALGTWAVFFTSFDWRAVTHQATDAIGGLEALPLIAAMAILPVFGFPIMPVYVVAGVRFGLVGGGAVVAFATAVHLLGSYLIARSFLRHPVERLLGRWHARLPHIPRDEEPAVALIAALIPGLPYFVRNYLLALAGVRLWVYMSICLPIYVARSYVSILLGDFGADDPGGKQFFIIAAFELLKVVICGLVIWWLREHHRRVHGHEHDRDHDHPEAAPQNG